MSKAKDARIARLESALRMAGYSLIAASRFAPTKWQLYRIQAWADSAIKASVGRNPKGQDRETGLGRNDEHAVGEAETPNPGSTPETGLVEALEQAFIFICENCPLGPTNDRTAAGKLVDSLRVPLATARDALSNVLKQDCPGCDTPECPNRTTESGRA